MVSKGVKVTTKKRRRVVREAVNATEEALRDYEMVLIISPEVSEEESEIILSDVSKLIDRDGGGGFPCGAVGQKKAGLSHRTFYGGQLCLNSF